LIGLIAIVLTLALNVPLWLKGAIQFDGSRNADSFTFINNARYALSHAFYGAPDFSPAHPIFTIARSYFGDQAIQPRPAGECFLAWLSALRGVDPAYGYNGLQTAAVLLGGLSVFVFLATDLRWRSRRTFTWLAWLVLACPTLLFVAVNSNFANGITLAAGTAYVGLGLLPERRSATFAAAVLFLGCLMSGYAELMVFVGAIRFFAVVIQSVSGQGLRWFLRQTGLLLGELLAACLLLPWAAKSTWIDYVTTLGVSHAGASELGGNMYAGLPLAITALALLCVTWRSLASLSSGRCVRALLAATLLAFALAQLLMMMRGFSYGGFKISEYFVTSLAGIVLVCGVAVFAQVRNATMSGSRYRIGTAMLVVAVTIASLQDARMIKRSWEFASDRQITRDLLAMVQWMRSHTQNELIAMGPTPSSFYYGQWVPYLTDAHVVYDWSDPEAAGYLAPYLKLAETQRYVDAKLMLSIDDVAAPRPRQRADVAAFGRVHLSRVAGPP
jgi:hypothetical protein